MGEIAKLFITVGADVAGAMTGLKQVNGGLDDFGKSAAKMGVGASAFSAPLLALGKNALDVALDYESSMNQLQGVTGATGEQMTQLGAKAKELGADMDLPATSAGDATKAMLELSKGGLSVAQSMDAAKGVLQLSAAAGVDNARAAEIAANALNTFGLEGAKATEVANLFAAAANASSADINDVALAMAQAGTNFKQARIPIDEATTAISLMANAGIKGSDAGTSLKTMITALMAPSSAAAKEMAKFGISVFDADGSMRPFRDLIAEFSQKLTVGNDVVIKASAVTKEMTAAYKVASGAAGPLATDIDNMKTRLQILKQQQTESSAATGEGSVAYQKQRLAIQDLSASLEDKRKKLEILKMGLTDAKVGSAEHTAAVKQQELAIKNLSQSIAEKTAKLPLLKQKLDETIKSQGAGSVAAREQQLAIQKLTGDISSDKDQLGLLQGQLERTKAGHQLSGAEAAKQQLAIKGLTDDIGQGQARLQLMEGELAKTAKGHGAGSVEAQKQQLAIKELSDKIAEGEAKLGGYQNTIAEYETAARGSGETTVKMTEAMKAHAVATIFGSDAQRAANIVMAGGVEKFDEMHKGVTKQGAASELAGSRMKGLSGAIQGFQSVAETAMLEAVEPFLPDLEKLVKFAASCVQAFSNLPEPMKKMIVVFGAAVAVAGPLAVAVGAVSLAIGAISAPVAIAVAAIIGLGLALTALVTMAPDIISGFKKPFEWFGQFGSWLVGLISAGIQSVKAAFGIHSPSRVMADEVGGPLAMGVAEGITGVLGKVFPGILLGPVGAAIQLLLPVVQGLAPKVAGALAGFAGAVAEKIKGGADAIGSGLSGAAQTAAQHLSPVVARAREVLGPLAAAVGEYVGPAARAIGDTLQPVGQAAYDRLAPVAVRARDALRGLAGAVDENVRPVVGRLAEALQAAPQTAADRLGGVAEQARQKLGGLAQIGRDAAGGLRQNLADGLSALWDDSAHGAIARAAAGIGDAISAGIGAGISAAKGVVDAAKGAAQSALDKAKAFLGIHSPSRVFADQVGLPMGQGIAVGLERAQASIASALGTLTAPVNLGDFAPDVPAAGSSAAAGVEAPSAPRESVEINVNVLGDTYGVQNLQDELLRALVLAKRQGKLKGLVA